MTPESTVESKQKFMKVGILQLNWQYFPILLSFMNYNINESSQSSNLAMSLSVTNDEMMPVNDEKSEIFCIVVACE